MPLAIANDPGRGRTREGVVAGMGAGALWGLVFLAPELARAFTPLQLAVGRYLAYGLLSLSMAWPQRRSLLAGLDRRAWVTLAWLGLAGNTLYYVLLSTAVQAGGIALASLVIGFLPVAVTIVGSRDAGAVPLRRLAPSLALCAAGAACIGGQALDASLRAGGAGPLVGLLCAVGTLASWTAFAVGNSRWLARHPAVTPHQWNLLLGIATGAQALALLPLAMLTQPMRHGADDWLLFAGVSMGVAVLASMLGNALWNRMTRLLPLTLVGQMILFETLFALLYGFAWEHRLPGPLEAASLLLVVASVLSCLAAHRPTATPRRETARPESRGASPAEARAEVGNAREAGRAS